MKTSNALVLELEDLLRITTDGDTRAKAKNYIVQLSVRNMTADERRNVNTFILKSIKEEQKKTEGIITSDFEDYNY